MLHNSNVLSQFNRSNISSWEFLEDHYRHCTFYFCQIFVCYPQSRFRFECIIEHEFDLNVPTGLHRQNPESEMDYLSICGSSFMMINIIKFLSSIQKLIIRVLNFQTIDPEQAS